MPHSEMPLEESSDACFENFEPTCSSLSSGISCTHADLDSDNPDTDDASSDHKEIEASGSLSTAWTDSKHSSYLDFMEQTFVRDLYDREYCALDVCGKQCQRLYHVEEVQDPNSAESRFPSPLGHMEFKVWENGNWTWRQDSNRKVNPCTLLSNPWFKHFSRKSFPERDIKNTTRIGSQQDATQTVRGIPGSRGIETSSPVCRGDSELEANLDINQSSNYGDARTSLKRTAQVKHEQGSTIRRRASLCFDEGSVTSGVLGKLCKGGDGEGNPFYYSCMQHSGDG